MTLQVQHPVVDWYLAFDDIWELMSVNWQTHNPFTQAGMWAAGEYQVLGLVMVVDTPPYRGVLLQVSSDDMHDHAAVITYGPKCNECGFQPYNALWAGGVEEMEAIGWGGSVICDMITNAFENPPERFHHDECSRLIYNEEADDPEEVDEGDD